MKCYVIFSVMKGFSAFSSTVTLISRKVTKDKRMVTEFRHVIIRITKNDLAYPFSQRYIFNIGEF